MYSKNIPILAHRHLIISHGFFYTFQFFVHLQSSSLNANYSKQNHTFVPNIMFFKRKYDPVQLIDCEHLVHQHRKVFFFFYSSITFWRASNPITFIKNSLSQRKFIHMFLSYDIHTTNY